MMSPTDRHPDATNTPQRTTSLNQACRCAWRARGRLRGEGALQLSSRSGSDHAGQRDAVFVGDPLAHRLDGLRQ
jgi:hypothetical protein